MWPFHAPAPGTYQVRTLQRQAATDEAITSTI